MSSLTQTICAISLDVTLTGVYVIPCFTAVNGWKASDWHPPSKLSCWQNKDTIQKHQIPNTPN